MTRATANLPVAPRPVARQPRSESLRRSILSASAEEFAAKGFEGGTMRSIARSLGIELAHIQHHFGDKRSLWSAVLSDVIGGYVREHEPLLQAKEDDDPAAIMATLIESLIRYAAEHPTFVAIMAQARTASSEYTLVYQREVGPSMRRWVELIAAAQEQGRFVSGNPGILFYQLVGAATRIFGAAVDAVALIGRQPTDPRTIEEHIRTCIDVFMPGQRSFSSKRTGRTRAKHEKSSHSRRSRTRQRV